jgi:hypothetical protein
MKIAAMEQGLNCYPGGGSIDGRLGAHLLLAPPFIAEQLHFEALAGKLGKVFDSVFA